ncbi:MAG TPA: hypothetical protein VGC54_11255 [Planctomycetota bacterium]
MASFLERTPSALLLAALAALPLACSAGGGYGGANPDAELRAAVAGEGIFPEVQPARVTFKDNRTGVTIGVLNESHTQQSEYYSAERSSLTYKVIPDLDMGALLKQLTDLGFFTAARVGTARVPGARNSVMVERGGQSWLMAFNTADSPEHVQLVQQSAAAVQAMYNYHQAFQVIENPEGADYFQDEKARIESSPRRRP